MTWGCPRMISVCLLLHNKISCSDRDWVWDHKMDISHDIDSFEKLFKELSQFQGRGDNGGSSQRWDFPVYGRPARVNDCRHGHYGRVWIHFELYEAQNGQLVGYSWLAHCWIECPSRDIYTAYSNKINTTTTKIIWRGIRCDEGRIPALNSSIFIFVRSVVGILLNECIGFGRSSLNRALEWLWVAGSVRM